MSEQEVNSKTIAEIREWLVRIDTNQTHQTSLLEAINISATHAADKAEIADNKADDALEVARRVEKEFAEYRAEEKNGRRWLIGILIPVTIAVLPLLKSFYL